MADDSFFRARPCPCGSGGRFDTCCGPLLRGEPAPTAEALMRSRYTAHVEGDAQHLLATWHPTTRPDSVTVGEVEWLGLEIVDTVAGGADDEEGVVEFVARFEELGSPGIHQERSTFVRQGGRWRYVDVADD